MALLSNYINVNKGESSASTSSYCFTSVTYNVPLMYGIVPHSYPNEFTISEDIVPNNDACLTIPMQNKISNLRKQK